MLFLDFAYVTLSPSLTFSFLVAWRDRELLPGFPGKACRDKHKLILFSGECGTPRPRPLRPLSQARLAPTHSELCLGYSTFYGCSSHAFKGHGRRASRHSSNNNYFISPEHHTQLQMAETEVSPFNENFISHCLRIPAVSSSYTGPGTSDFSFCKGDGELPVFKKDHSLDAASKGVVILKLSSRHIPYCSNFNSK